MNRSDVMSRAVGWSVLGLLILAIPYGGAIGTLVGFVIGVPTAMLTTVIARRTQYWRGCGTVLSALCSAAVAWMAFGSGSGVPVLLACGAMAAGNAWFALPKILKMRPGRYAVVAT